MKVFKLKFRTIAIGILAFALSMQAFGTGNPRTPDAKEPADINSRGVSPYVPPANVYVPDSSKAVNEDAGKRAHTNVLIQNPSGTQPKALLDKNPPKPPANPN